MVFWTLMFGSFLMTNFLNGFVEVILGSILPDLRCLLNTDLNSLSYLFLAFTLGVIPGFATANYVITRCRPFLTLFVLLLTQSVALSVLPLAPVIYVTAVCVCIFGFNTASSFSLILNLLDVYWTGSTKRVYVLLSVYSAGSVFCPLIPHTTGIKQIRVVSIALIGQFLGGLLLFGTRLLLGSSGGAYFPTGLTWARETLNMNPARKSVCLTSMATGFLFPYACGFLMSLYGDEVFEYFVLSLAVFSGFMFILLNIVL